MLKSNKKSRKTRSDKFPMTLHKTGQYCKKIKGKLFYFGVDKKKALQSYLEQASYLHSGKPPVNNDTKSVSIKTLANRYLDHQESRVEAGEIKQRQLYDQTRLLKHFVKYISVNRAVSEMTTIDLQNYRKKLVKDNKSANTINNYISAIKAMYNWAEENELIDKTPNLKAVKKITAAKIEKQIFTPQQIQKLICSANQKLKAMILLGLNCGFGCTDCSELKWENIDLENSRVVFPRGKTGVNRNLPLWPETIEALSQLSRNNEYIFITKKGNKYVRVVRKEYPDGTTKLLNYNAISKEFSELIKKTNIKTEKGVGFYTLRRTAATLAARSGDPFAVQKLLGHTDLKMASVYVQDVSEQTDRVINNTRKLIIQDGS
jgi:integrase